MMLLVAIDVLGLLLIALVLWLCRRQVASFVFICVLLLLSLVLSQANPEGFAGDLA